MIGVMLRGVYTVTDDNAPLITALFFRSWCFNPSVPPVRVRQFVHCAFNAALETILVGWPVQCNTSF